MIFISHRGNTEGVDLKRENTTSYIQQALDLGYDVEIDLWGIKDKIYLGHDGPLEMIDEEFLYARQNNLWIHCKNYVALDFCISKKLHCFYHHTDKYTITSRGFVWAYPGEPRSSSNCISVLPEYNTEFKEYVGVCSDNIKLIKESDV